MKYVFPIVILSIMLFSCQNQDQKKPAPDLPDKIAKTADSKEDVEIKQVFYNVPSPVEVVQIIQDAGANYNEDLLNPYINVDNYITTEDLALNLGVYGADLSYNRIFDQMQESLNYLVAIRKITDQLKIPQEEGTFAIGRFEKNLENRDSLLKVISETYANADIYLKENQRESTATLIVLGGWIEALYIATNLVDQKMPDNTIMERIAEQKYSLTTIIQLIENHSDEFVTVNEFGPKMSLLVKAFEKIKIENTPGKVETNKESKSTTIGGLSQIEVEYSNVLEIKNIITEIRNQIIGKS
jgi:hypothetical protein